MAKIMPKNRNEIITKLVKLEEITIMIQISQIFVSSFSKTIIVIFLKHI